jgi:hypothetical protein
MTGQLPLRSGGSASRAEVQWRQCYIQLYGELRHVILHVIQESYGLWGL